MPVLGYLKNSETGFSILSHVHRDKLEFIVMLDGVKELMASGVKYTIYPGDVFVIKANEEHMVLPSSDYELLWFQIDLSDRERLLDLNRRLDFSIFTKLKELEARQFKVEPNLIKTYKEAFSFLCKNGAAQKAKGSFLFCYAVMETLDSEVNKKLLTEEIHFAKQYISSHVKEAIDLDELIGKSGLSVSEFKEKFNEQIGMSPKEYINLMKIEKAKYAVAKTDAFISDIAYEFNFSSVGYFKMVFKKAMGYTPQKYRKLYKKGKLEIF